MNEPKRNAWSVAADVLTICLSVAWLLPLIFTILMAFRPQADAITNGNIFIGRTITPENFIAAWEAAPWLNHLISSIAVVVGTLVVQLITMTMAGYAFAKLKFRFRSLILGFILLQLMIPTGVLIIQNLNAVRSLGIFDTWIALMAPYWGSAFGVLLMRQAFREIPNDLEEAARIDGANTMIVLWRIYIPLSIPTYVAFALVSISARWNEFLWPFIATRTEDVRPLTVGLNKLFQATESGALYGQLMSGTLIVIAPLVILFIFFQRRFIESFASSGIK